MTEKFKSVLRLCRSNIRSCSEFVCEDGHCMASCRRNVKSSERVLNKILRSKAHQNGSKWWTGTIDSCPHQIMKPYHVRFQIRRSYNVFTRQLAKFQRDSLRRFAMPTDIVPGNVNQWHFLRWGKFGRVWINVTKMRQYSEIAWMFFVKSWCSNFVANLRLQVRNLTRIEFLIISRH
jgi:hypothetical protein